MTSPAVPTPCPHPDAGEILLVRKITFRNSTYGALKTFIRENEHRTGEHLTNAAAIDHLLRAQLAHTINRHAVTEMQALTRASGRESLQAIPDKDQGSAGQPQATQTPRISLTPIGKPEGTAPATRTINIDVRKMPRKVTEIVAATNNQQEA